MPLKPTFPQPKYERLSNEFKITNESISATRKDTQPNTGSYPNPLNDSISIAKELQMHTRWMQM